MYQVNNASNPVTPIHPTHSTHPAFGRTQSNSDDHFTAVMTRRLPFPCTLSISNCQRDDCKTRPSNLYLGFATSGNAVTKLHWAMDKHMVRMNGSLDSHCDLGTSAPSWRGYSGDKCTFGRLDVCMILYNTTRLALAVKCRYDYVIL